MELGWNAAQRALARHYEQFAAAHIAPRSDRFYHRGTGGLDRPSWERLAAEGFWRIPVPESLGGHGGSWWDFAAALEGVTRGGRDLGFCLSLIAHAGLVRSLLLFGGEHHHRDVLPRLLSGAVGATALTESRGGSDVAGTTTSARRHGAGYVLDGAKEHITNAPVADVFWVLGRVADLPAKRDITVFVVERGEGVTTGPPEHMFGNRTSPTGPIMFDAVPVSAEQILGRPGAGLSLTYATIGLDRLLYGIVGAAYLEGLLADVMGFAAQRRAFGLPIADFQYVQRRITNVKIAIETARWVSYAALGALVTDAPEAALMSSTAKLVGSEGLAGAALDVMQVFGHAGYEVGRHSRNVSDALGTLIAGGTSDIQRKNIFTQLTKLAAARGRPESVPPAARAA
jgi:isovaleryl-CoA dehydrogenase